MRARFCCGFTTRWPGVFTPGHARGFTLIELLVVIAIITILAGLLFPIFASSRDAAKKVKCASQLKQLAAAVMLYADDNDSRYVPAASDIDGPGGGLLRWHGSRTRPNREFDPKLGPLWVYLARCGGLKKCPQGAMLQTKLTNPNAFESGCGGYGYNRDYVGGTYYRNPSPKCARLASLASDIRRPSKTIMFADAAMPNGSGIVEYSFCEPPYNVYGGRATTSRNSPSIHFRHVGLANVAWCDGHVSSVVMSFSVKANIYGADCGALDVGWFGPDNNSMFGGE